MLEPRQIDRGVDHQGIQRPAAGMDAVHQLVHALQITQVHLQMGDGLVGNGQGGQGFGGFSGGLGDIFENFFGQAFAQVQVELTIKLSQALLGDSLEVQTPYGERVKLNLPAGTQDGQTFQFRGRGQAYKGGRGDLLITVRIRFPQRLTPEQKKALEQLRNAGL